MALASTTSTDFGAGMYRGREAPENAVYDAINALIDDEGQLYKRGGSEYLSGDAGETFVGLADVIGLDVDGALVQRIIAWTATVAYAVDDTGSSTLIGDFTTAVPKPFIRGTGVGEKWIAPSAVTANGVAVWDGATIGPGLTEITYATTAAVDFVTSAGQRLLIADGAKVRFTERGDIATQNAGDYHELPNRARITGMDTLADTALVFTTAGVWAISNLVLDPVDAYGNIQHQVEKINEVLLWGDSGIAGHAGALIVPAIDDVYALAPGGGVTVLSAAIRPLYRSYVEAGCQPGIATVHRGHYFLPILNPPDTDVVDVLVCRLDRGAAWTRWAGHGAATGFVTQIGASTREPKLLGIAGARVIDLTDAFTPSAANAAEADGTTGQLEIVTRDYPTGQQHGFFKTARVRYELAGAGTTVTDSFERADESPLGTGYSAWRGSKPDLVTGSAVNTGDAGDGKFTTRSEPVGPDGYVETTLDTQVSSADLDSWWVGFRLTAHSDLADGYMLSLEAGSGGMRARIRRGSSRTVIATSAVTNYAGVDGMRLVVEGTVLTGYLRISGVWTEAVVTATDRLYPDAGYVGFGIDSFFGTLIGIETFSWASYPTVLSGFTSDADGGVFEELAERGEQGGGAGWGASDGSLYQWALVAKKRERGRLRLIVSGACASFVLRSIELLVRQSGRQ